MKNKITLINKDVYVFELGINEITEYHIKNFNHLYWLERSNCLIKTNNEE